MERDLLSDHVVIRILVLVPSRAECPRVYELSQVTDAWIALVGATGIQRNRRQSLQAPQAVDVRRQQLQAPAKRGELERIEGLGGRSSAVERVSSGLGGPSTIFRSSTVIAQHGANIRSQSSTRRSHR